MYNETRLPTGRNKRVERTNQSFSAHPVEPIDFPTSKKKKEVKEKTLHEPISFPIKKKPEVKMEPQKEEMVQFPSVKKKEVVEKNTDSTPLTLPPTKKKEVEVITEPEPATFPPTKKEAEAEPEATPAQLPKSDIPETDILYGPSEGMNTRDLQSRINGNEAVLLQNYVVLGDGRIRVREGISEKEDFSGTPSFIEFLTNDICVYGYDDGSNSRIATYTFSTDTSEVINTFTSQDDITGTAYKKYFYASDGTDKIGCFHENGKFVDFQSKTGDFTVGLTVVGGTSGATGVIQAIQDGTSGTLVLTDMTGTFQSGEAITDTSTGAATTSSVAYIWYELGNAPAAKCIFLHESTDGTYLVAANTDVDESSQEWSEAHIQDRILEIPFHGWSSSTIPEPDDAGGRVSSGGAINKGISHKNFMVFFSENATSAIKLDIVNVDSVGLAQKTVVQHQEPGFGGYDAVSTPFGIFYTNPTGLYQMELSGTGTVEKEPTNILGEDAIENIDFSNSNIVWDGRDHIYVFCGENGSTNNLTLSYNLSQEAISYFRGWNIRMAIRRKNGGVKEMYGVDSKKGKIYKLFDGYNDIDLPINTRFVTKKNIGDPALIKRMKNIWIQGLLSPTAVIKTAIHTWDKANKKTSPKNLWWGGSIEAMKSYGWGKTGWGKGVSGVDDVFVSEDFAHKSRPTEDFLGYQIEISAACEESHEIHFIELEIIGKRRVKMDNLSETKL